MSLSFADWTERQIQSAPDDIRAFAFNLYENSGVFSVGLVGARTYLPNNSDWACEEDFVPSSRIRWAIPPDLSGSNWETCLLAMRRELVDLMDRAEIKRLVNADAVAIGFVDGDLLIVHPDREDEV